MDSENIVWHFLNTPTNLPNYTDIPTSLADIPDMVQIFGQKGRTPKIGDFLEFWIF